MQALTGWLPRWVSPSVRWLRLLPAAPWLRVALVPLALLIIAVPLPGLLIDVLLAAQLLFALGVAWQAARATGARSLPGLPAWLLASVLARLCLTMASLRLILADTGESWLLPTISDLLSVGEPLVGAVLLLALLTVSYFVISRGGERVAEVAARFALDALPGRQAAVESDLRIGAISFAHAQRQRSHLEEEARLFSALDGTVRILRGDILATALLLLLGFVTSVAIAVTQTQASFAQAAAAVASQILGLGLLTQATLLFHAVAAGAVLTATARAEPRSPAAAPTLSTESLVVTVEKALAADLPPSVCEAIRQRASQRLGLPLPPLVLQVATDEAPRQVVLRQQGITLAHGRLAPGEDLSLFLETALASLAPELLSIELVQHALATLEPSSPTLLREVLPKCIEIGPLTALLRELIRQRILPLDLRAVLQALLTLPARDSDVRRLAEQVRGQLGRALVQGYLTFQPSDKPATGKTTQLGLYPADLPVLLLAAEIEAALRDLPKSTGSRRGARLEPELAHEIVESALSAKRVAKDAVLLCHADVRTHVEDLLESTPEALPVFAYSELPKSIRVIVMGRVEPGHDSTSPQVDSAAVPWQLRVRE